jgi:hypothetical protein
MTPLEILFCKDIKYEWTSKCQQDFDTLKEKLVTIPILIFLDWSKIFHVHVDASSIALGDVLAHPREGSIDHPIYFYRIKLYDVECNYNTIEREVLAMVYALQKFYHYSLGSIFKLFADHFSLNYIVKNPVLGGLIYWWLLLFQEFDFEIVVKPGKHNAGSDHLSHIETREFANSLDKEILDAKIFYIEAIPYQIAEIYALFISQQAPREYTLA